jgi:uncharacterized protein YjbJ (UPF0337 family)
MSNVRGACFDAPTAICGRAKGIGLRSSSLHATPLRAEHGPIDACERETLHCESRNERRNGFALDALGLIFQQRRRKIVDSEHVKGAADKVKGAIKDTAGKVTGDKELQAEGKFDKAKGAAHNAAGDAKDAFRNATKP